MSSNQFISQTERRLLFVLVITICCVFYSHLAITQIEEHNLIVKNEQSEKLFQANTPPSERISFSNCFFSPPIITQIFWLQFLTNPILLLIMWKPKPLKTFISIIINFVITLSLFSWINRNYISYRLNEINWFHPEPYGYFTTTSNISSVFLTLLCCIFLTIQFWLLIRFVIEKFQDKISLR